MKNTITKFRVFMFVYWAMMLSVIGMYVMYITELGFSKQQISIAVSVSAASLLFGQSFIGFVVDKFKCPKRIMFLCISIGLFVAILLPYVKSPLTIYSLLVLWFFFVLGTVPLSETWCLDMLKARNQQRDFGKVRGFGSVGYGFTAPLLGYLLHNLGWKIYNWYIFAITLIVLAVLFTLEEAPMEEISIEKQASANNSSVREVFADRSRIVGIIGIIFIMFAYFFVVRGIYSYLGVLVSDFGGGTISMGFTFFFDATPELVTFFLAASLMKKLHSKHLILFAFLLQIIRLTVILIFNNAAAVILMGVLSGFAYGLVAVSYKTYIYELAPPKYRVSCMSLSESIIGFSGIASAPVFGFMFTKFGTNSTILFGLVIYIVFALVMLMMNFKTKYKAVSELSR